MSVNTESREDLENRYKESKGRWEDAMWDKEQAKNAYEGAKSNYETHENEAEGEWGNDIPPGNTAEYREELKEERDKKWDEYREASAKEEEANKEFNGYEKTNPNTGEKYHEPGVKDEYENMKKEEEEDNDVGY